MYHFHTIYRVKNIFSESIKRTASIPTSAIISLMAWITASAPTSWPVLSCKDYAAFATSFLYNIITDLAVILLSTFPKPIDLKPRCLSNGISLLTEKVWRDCADCSSSEQSFLMKFVKTLQRSLDECLNCLQINIPRHHQHWDLMVRSLLLLALLVAWPKTRGCHHMRPGELVWMGPCRGVSDKDCLGSWCFYLSKSSIF